jgi:hypothetical protein
MRARIAGVAWHVVLAGALAGAVVVGTAGTEYPPLRRALVIFSAVLIAVSVLARLPQAFGPLDQSWPAAAVRLLGTGLAAAVGVAIGLDGHPTDAASTGLPILSVICAIYVTAVIAATGRGSTLTPQLLLQAVGLAWTAVALWAIVVVLAPPAASPAGDLLIVIASLAAGRLAMRRGPLGGRQVTAGLLTAVLAALLMVPAAQVMYHFGPDRWAPYAGPGPLTPQAQLEQNRAEAVDPYVGVLVLGAIAAIVLVMSVLVARGRARAPLGATPREAG